MSEEIVIVPKLSKNEEKALALYERLPQPPISPTVQKQFFELFLNGKSCYEIQKLNSGFHLGAIVKARVEGNWDKLLAEYRDEMLANTVSRAKQINIEAVGFVGDLLSATHKYHGKRLAKYLQTGDESELGELDIKSVNTYKTVLGMLVELTGQGSTVTHKHDVAVRADGNVPPAVNITPAMASQVLNFLAGTGGSNGT